MVNRSEFTFPPNFCNEDAPDNYTPDPHTNHMPIRFNIPSASRFGRSKVIISFNYPCTRPNGRKTPSPSVKRLKRGKYSLLVQQYFRLNLIRLQKRWYFIPMAATGAIVDPAGMGIALSSKVSRSQTSFRVSGTTCNLNDTK